MVELHADAQQRPLLKLLQPTLAEIERPASISFCGGPIGPALSPAPSQESQLERHRYNSPQCGSWEGSDRWQQTGMIESLPNMVLDPKAATVPSTPTPSRTM
jgi:hypothetical protein